MASRNVLGAASRDMHDVIGRLVELCLRANMERAGNEMIKDLAVILAVLEL
jgi:hypothetical protein